MKVIRDHFEGKVTILINDRIINGCQNFSMEEAPAVLAEYNVPSDVWQQVLDIYTGTSTEEEILSFVNDEDSGVRCVVAEQGYGLDQLVNDEDWHVRCVVAEQGYGLDQLVKDEDWCVRCVVAEQGYGLDQLVNDVSPAVRYAVEKQGTWLDTDVNRVYHYRMMYQDTTN